jgi:HEAT repeat protein
MSPLAVFVRTLMTSSAIFIGAGTVFLNPSLDWSSSRAVTAQKGVSGQAVDALTAALEDPDAGVRRQAASALGEIRNPRSVPALIAAAGDENREVRRHAARALGAIGDDRALPALTQALSDADAAVRRAAVTAIASITTGGRHLGTAPRPGSDPAPHPAPAPAPRAPR